MKRALAIARLTFWEGIRMRIVLVFLIVLIFIVLRLPFALRGDETLAGRLQTFLSYSLGALGVFLSLATIFFSCSTLASEIEKRTLHLVVTKPVRRFEILLGKWLGVNALNILIILASGLVIYGLALFIKTRPESFARDRLKIEDVVWTARIAATPTPPDFQAYATEEIEERIGNNEEFLAGKQRAIAERALEMRGLWHTVPPGDTRLYKFENLPPPRSDEAVYQIRYKARAVPYDTLVGIAWAVVHPQTGALLQIKPTEMRSSEIHQFLVRVEAVIDGAAAIGVQNTMPVAAQTSILFEGDDSLQLLYKTGSFEANYTRTLLLIFFRVAFLSALGVFFGTFVSFPVACFCVLSMFLMCIGTPWWLESLGASAGVMTDKTDPFGLLGPFAARVMVWSVLVVIALVLHSFVAPRPLWLSVLGILIGLELLHRGIPIYTGWHAAIVLRQLFVYVLPNLVRYNGVAKLIDGYAIDPVLMVAAMMHTLIYGAALLMLPGWLIFRSREVAETIV